MCLCCTVGRVWLGEDMAIPHRHQQCLPPETLRRKSVFTDLPF